jgi:serine/threonine protein kinase
MRSFSQEYFSQLDSLFHQALGISAEADREAFLKISCGEDAAMREDIRRLLEGDFAVRRSASVSRPLPRFGVYQARELIGRGGMGAVYLATREDGEVSLRVAVKVISSPLWSSLLEERFRRERQILAQLRHPGIAAFLDGGVSDDGLPFLVMEYVEGEPIDRYCDGRRLSVRTRLELFLQVCAAVDFAHRQFIVHRDIKPGNVLVTPPGEPRLLDFGLARTMESASPQEDNPTLFLTPLYSCPEVLRGRPAAVTDDVYSLGILLYELLAGQRPFGSAGSTPAEVIESVLGSEPRRASLMAGSSADIQNAEAMADARGTTVAELRRTLEGDLDAIALRAVAGRAADRYPSVTELAEDVRRYLAGHPVRAAAGGTLYRARKLIARHRVLAAAAILLALSITAGTAATWIQAREARLQRAAAERRFQDARDLARYMMFELQTSIQTLPGSTPVKADMVRHSLTYLDRIAAEKTNDDALRVDIAEGYSELADVLGHPLRPNLGEAAEARGIYDKAIGILRPVVARDPGNPRARRALARAQLMLGMSLTFYRQWDEGRKLVDTSAAELDRLASGWPRDFDILREAALAREFRAVTVSQRDGYTTGGDQTAVADLQQAIRYGQSALGLKPAEPEATEQLASSYNRLALLTQTHDRPAAAKYFDEALATLATLPPAGRATAAVRNRRASILLAAGWNLGSAGDFDRGIADIHESRDMIERLAAEDPQNRIYPQARASIYRNLGVIEDYAGHTADALSAYLTAISLFEQMLAASPQNPYYRTTLADLEANAALLSEKLGRRADGLRLARAGIPVLRQTALKPDASASELNLAARFLTEKSLAEFCDAKLGLQFAQRANTAAGGKDYVLLETLGQAYWMNRDREDAMSSIRQAMALIETPEPGAPPSRVRRVFEKTMAGYSSDELPAPCH